MSAAQPQANPDREFRLDHDECRSLVARISASPDFHRAARLRGFLNYVVEQTLAGKTEEITETLIGHRVFGRRSSYNPGEDSIVRTEARTLRQRLERYFAANPNEPVILEVPRGGYIPVFRQCSLEPVKPTIEVRFPPTPEEPLPQLPVSRRHALILGASVASLTGIGWWIKSRASDSSRLGSSLAPNHAALQLESSDTRLSLAFARARERALAGVFTGDPVGDWYAGNRDNRAFCMRDTVHESVGAALLGLFPQTLNMMRRFAASIAASRRWCGYWIITKDGFPAPIDYASDETFVYSLPANFDLMRSFHRQFLWTGNRQYLDPVFTSFCDHTVTSYVQAWDRNGDGIMEGRPDSPRVSASYNQQAHFLTGGDMIAAQYAGYLAYAALQDLKGGPGSLSQRIAQEHRVKADALRKHFNTAWWDVSQNRFHAGLMPDGSWWPDYAAQCNVYPLKFGIPEDGPKTDASLDLMEHDRPPYDSTFSHYPEVLYRYGRNDSAYRYLLEITDPSFSGYNMSEIAFAALGAMGTGLMGIDPDALQSVETLSRLPREMAWSRLSNIPVGSNQITVEHRGPVETHFTNQSGAPIAWKAVFRIPALASSAGILIDGAAAPKLTIEQRPNRQFVICTTVTVNEGHTRVAMVHS